MKDAVFYKQIIQSQAKQIDTLIEMLNEYKSRCNWLESHMDKLLDELDEQEESENHKPSNSKDLADTLTYILKFLSDND